MVEKAVQFEVNYDQIVFEKYDTAAIVESLRSAAAHVLYFMADIVDVTLDNYYVGMHRLNAGFICFIGGPKYDNDGALDDNDCFVDIECLEAELKRVFKDDLEECGYSSDCIKELSDCVVVSQACNIFTY